MFNLSGSEIVVILLLALIVLGPDKLPDAMRRAGKTFAEIKKLSSGFQDEVRKGFEDPVREVKQTAEAVKSAARFPTITSAGASDKPRYNPATDPVPEPPEGSSVGEPLADVPTDATAGPADEAIDVADDAPATDDVEADATPDTPTEADRTA